MPRAAKKSILPSKNARPILLETGTAERFEVGDLIPRSYYVVATADPTHRKVFARAFWGRQQANVAAAFDYPKDQRVVVLTGAQLLKHVKEAGLYVPPAIESERITAA